MVVATSYCPYKGFSSERLNSVDVSACEIISSPRPISDKSRTLRCIWVSS